LPPAIDFPQAEHVLRCPKVEKILNTRGQVQLCKQNLEQIEAAGLQAPLVPRWELDERRGIVDCRVQSIDGIARM